MKRESECGKSWLRQKVVPDSIVVQRRLDPNVHNLCVDALSQLGVKLILDNTKSGKITGRVEAEASVGKGLIAIVLGARGTGTAGIDGDWGSETRMAPVGQDVTDLRFIAELLKASARRLVIEDFHYLSIDERQKFAFDLKAL